ISPVNSPGPWSANRSSRSPAGRTISTRPRVTTKKGVEVSPASISTSPLQTARTCPCSARRAIWEEGRRGKRRSASGCVTVGRDSTTGLTRAPPDRNGKRLRSNTIHDGARNDVAAELWQHVYTRDGDETWADDEDRVAGARVGPAFPRTIGADRVK